MAYLYTTVNRFANDDAVATRVFTFCKILNELGKEVLVISLDEIEARKIHVYKGINFITLRSSSNGIAARISNIIFHRIRLKKTLENLSQSLEIEGLFFYDIPPPSIYFLKKYAKQKNIKIFHDSVEWYSPQQFKWGKFALPYVFKNLLNKYFIDRQISVFAVSNYLNKYFQSRGIHSIHMPIMVDKEEIKFEKSILTKKLKLIYAGAPGKKDYLKVIVEGLAKLQKEELESVELHILGINENQLVETCGIRENTISKCGQSLIAVGRVSRSEVLKFLQTANFTVLLRSSELRYAKAGFPSKVVESLATGTPIICNLTSDLGDYLINGENSIIVNSCSSDDFASSLRKALCLSFEKKKELCYKARETAVKHFDYRNYLEQFNSFLCAKYPEF